MRDVSPASPPTTADFRKLMGQFATGVCVVSVETEPGTIAAMTINSFVSVSLDPLLVSWSLHNSSSQFAIFAEAERFAVSILAQDQAEVALRYAARGDSRMQGDDFTTSLGGLPRIDGSVGYFECRRWSSHPAGDHTMLLGEVTGMSPAPSSDEDGGATTFPLGFFNGQFCSIGQ